MDALVLRVAARTAGFVPSKFFREKKAALRKILTDPLDRSEAGHIGWKILDRVVPFFETFKKELNDFGLNQFAEQSVEGRVNTIKDEFVSVATKFNAFKEALGAVPYPTVTPTDEVRFYIQMTIENHFEAKVKTLADALKGTWHTDAKSVEDLAKKALKKATPEELAALDREAKDGGNSYNESTSKAKYDFYRRTNLEAASKRLVSIDRQAFKIDIGRWFDQLLAVLESNYSEPNASAFTEFYLHGVKVVIDDRTVSPDQVDQYVKYLSRAYELLKRKHLEKVWYGIIFIKCEDCGGFNPNTQQWHDVGGNYPIGPDVVNVFSRPSSGITELMAHELGHRYWFKFMRESQRGKFESFVKVHNRSKPIEQKPRTILVSKPLSAKSHVEEAAKELRTTLEPLKASRKRWFRDILKEHSEPIGKAGWVFQNAMIDAVHKAGASATINAEVKGLFDDFLKSLDPVTKLTSYIEDELSNEIHKEPDPAVAPESRDKFWMNVYRRVRDQWVGKLERAIDAAVATAFIYIDAAVLAYNAVEEGRNTEAWKQYNEEFEQDTRPVPSVSEYGKSNISEAFAEVFAFYVVGNFLTADQEASFVSVLKTAAERVVDRFVARAL